MPRFTWLGALILGVIALIFSYNVPQPPPLNTIEFWVGWILVVLALIIFLLGFFGGGPTVTDGTGRVRRWRF